MFIKKIMFKDGVTSVSYEDGDQTVTIKSSEAPRDSLIMALDKLKAPLFRNLGIPSRDDVEKDYADMAYTEVRQSTAKHERSAISVLFGVCGITHGSSEKKGVYFKVLALLGSSIVKTSEMFLPAGEENEDDLEHLTQDESDAMVALLREAEAFVAGVREQGQLFDAAGNPTEDATNEEEDPEEF